VHLERPSGGVQRSAAEAVPIPMRFAGTVARAEAAGAADTGLSFNQLTGGLEPLSACTSLQSLSLFQNQLTGGLEPLRGCTALRCLSLHNNKLTGGFEPLRGCKALSGLTLFKQQADR